MAEMNVKISVTDVEALRELILAAIELDQWLLLHDINLSGREERLRNALNALEPVLLGDAE